MSETQVRRRGFGEDGIYLDAARNRYTGAISLGYGPDGKRIRRKVSGKTKQEVRAKLQALHHELNSGVRSSSTYTLREAVDDWLREGLDGTSDRTRTLYEGLLGPVLEAIGARPLRVLSAGDVRSALSRLATRYSRRTLALPRRCVEALRQQQDQQERDRQMAGELWQEHGLVFASRVGTPLSANNVIRAFRLITKKAGLGEDWAPRELRHTFVSVMSANGVPVESIALLVGHDRTATTETVYRHEIRPALNQGAEVMDEVFG
jgi:integrase